MNHHFECHSIETNCFFFTFFCSYPDDIDCSDCISKKVLTQLSSDVAKLKAKGGIDTVNKSKLTLLINLAMRNVDIAKNLSAGPVSIENDFAFELPN